MSRPVGTLASGPDLTDDSRLELVPTLVKGTGDRFVVANRSNRGAILTGRVGVRAIELLRAGNTLGEMKRILAREHRCAPEEIDAGPLVASLWSAGLVSTIDGRRIHAKPRPGRRAAQLYLALFILSPLLSLALRYLPFQLAWWIADRAFHDRTPARVHRIEANLRAAPDLRLADRDLPEIAAANGRLVRAQLVERVLLRSLAPKRAARWLKRATRVSGMEHLERWQGRRGGTILCAYHMGSYSLIPFILGARGVALTVLGGFGETDQGSVAEWMAQVSESGVALPVRVISGTWALRALLESLARGETVLLYCDRAFGSGDGPTERARTLPVPFLGTTLHATTGVARLQARTGAAVLPAILLWEGDQRHHLRIERALQVESSADPNERVAAVTADIYRVLERYVRQYPAHWLKWKDFHHMIWEPPNVTGQPTRV